MINNTQLGSIHQTQIVLLKIQEVTMMTMTTVASEHMSDTSRVLSTCCWIRVHIHVQKLISVQIGGWWLPSQGCCYHFCILSLNCLCFITMTFVIIRQHIHTDIRHYTMAMRPTGYTRRFMVREETCNQ